MHKRRRRPRPTAPELVDEQNETDCLLVIKAEAADLLASLVEQLASVPVALLRGGELQVRFQDEEGEGVGPARELLDTAAQLFKPSCSTDSDLARHPWLACFRRAPGDLTGLAVVPALPETDCAETEAETKAAAENREGEQSKGGGKGGGKGRGRRRGRRKGVFQQPTAPDAKQVLAVCGRLLGLSVRNGTPLGVVLPESLWVELLAPEGRAAWEAYCLDDHEYRCTEMTEIM